MIPKETEITSKIPQDPLESQRIFNHPRENQQEFPRIKLSKRSKRISQNPSLLQQLGINLQSKDESVMFLVFNYFEKEGSNNMTST